MDSNNQKRTLPFLKWAGGKRWLANDLVKQIVGVDGRYIEPFLGSGAVFFTLRPRRAILSDLNSELIETYRTIQHSWQEVLGILQQHQELHSKAHYYATRSSKPEKAEGRAARFIYLNRTCWNGLYRVNLAGQFNVPIGTKDTVLLDTDDFKATAELLAGAKLCSIDFEAQIDKAKSGDVVFADPPYTVRHKFNGFIKYNESLFSWADQIRLRDAVLRAAKRGARVFVTNADHESIRTLYGGKGLHIYNVERYSSISGASPSRGKYPELIITNNPPVQTDQTGSSEYFSRTVTIGHTQ